MAVAQQVIMPATYPMNPPPIVSLLALISSAAIAPIQTAAMLMLLSTLLHPCAGHLQPLAIANREPNAPNVMCLNVPITLTQVHAVTKSAGSPMSTLPATCVRQNRQRPRRTR